jgi:hypothetical protein
VTPLDFLLVPILAIVFAILVVCVPAGLIALCVWLGPDDSDRADRTPKRSGRSKRVRGLDIDQLETLLENLRHDRQAELEHAIADPQSQQRYEDYWREREKVDSKP